jgi:ribonuclease HII
MDQKKDSKNLFEFDSLYKNENIKFLAGLDEAGRGPWAGPVTTAIVIFPMDINPKILNGLNDSKKLSNKSRREFFDIIKNVSLAYHISNIDHETIDKINIGQAINLGFVECVKNISVKPDLVLVDGIVKIKGIDVKQECICQGDMKSAVISAASILAKVTRDNLMNEFDKIYPQYKFAEHKGYGTSLHRVMLEKYGVCKIHRKSYKPIAEFRAKLK